MVAPRPERRENPIGLVMVVAEEYEVEDNGGKGSQKCYDCILQVTTSHGWL